MSINTSFLKGMITMLVILLSACGNSHVERKSPMLLVDTAAQSAIFDKLMNLTDQTIPGDVRNDSLAFLILPVQASCPSCRKRAIDSIVGNQDNLQHRLFILISANGGKKLISSFFKEYDQELPLLAGRLFLDTTNQAFKYDLYDAQPTMYYTSDQKVYRKVVSKPSDIKEDLRFFFSGGNIAE